MNHFGSFAILSPEDSRPNAGRVGMRRGAPGRVFLAQRAGPDVEIANEHRAVLPLLSARFCVAGRPAKRQGGSDHTLSAKDVGWVEEKRVSFFTRFSETHHLECRTNDGFRYLRA